MTTQVETKQVILRVDGMTCASCVAHVEGALKEVDGVADARVNLATEKATVEYNIATAGLKDLVEAIDGAGYKARLDRTTLSIGGITGDSPVALIESALKGVEGVLSANLNPSTQQATVEYVDTMVSIADL
ncbi:MAG: copper ion binding protein, partial [Chloroflexota bacterium]